MSVLEQTRNYNVPLYSCEALYHTGDKCVYNGEVWICCADKLHAKEFNPSDWYKEPKYIEINDGKSS